MTRRPLQATDLYRLRLLSDPQISPDGSRIAFVLKQMDEEQNDYAGNVFAVDRDGAVTQLTTGDKDWGPRWSPDGRYLAFVSGRKDQAQIHLLPMSGGESIRLTDLTLGAGLPVWSPDSRSIAFIGVVPTDPTEESEGEQKDGNKLAKTKIVERTTYKLDGAGYIGDRRRHLFLIDVAARTVEQMTDGDFHDDNPTWSPDGQHLAFSSNRSPQWDISLESDIYLMPRSGGEPHKLTSGGTYGRPEFSPDGSLIAFTGHQDPQDVYAPDRVYSVDRAGSGFRDELGSWDGAPGNQIVCDVVQSAEPYGVSLHWRPDGLHFIATEHGEANVYCAQGGAVNRVTDGKHTVVDYSIGDDGAVAYACGDALRPAEIFLQDIAAAEAPGTSVQLTHENDAFLSEVELIPPERLTFTGANGEKSEGWLIPPQNSGSGRHPLIVYIHGGPILAHGEALYFEYQLLAGQGFGVFYPNIHGSASYGRDYQLSIQGDWGNLDYQDVLAGLDDVVTRQWVDPERVGIAGGSYGGYMSSWAVAHTKRFRAAIVERCLCNMVSFMGTSDSGLTWRRMFGAYPEEDVQKLWNMSPIKYVADVDAPVLVIHSERDDRTPIEQGEQLFNALRRLNKRTKLIVYPEESHGLSRIGKPSRRVERLGHVLDWFREHL